MHQFPLAVLLTLAAVVACVTPTALLLLLAIALAAAMQPIRATVRITQRARNALTGRRETVDFCSCDHQATEHLHGTGHCCGQDANGQRCTCTSFDPEPDIGPDC